MTRRDARQFLNQLIDRVEIGPDKEARPYFLIPDPPRVDLGGSPTGHRFGCSQTTWSRSDSSRRLPACKAMPRVLATCGDALNWRLTCGLGVRRLSAVAMILRGRADYPRTRRVSRGEEGASSHLSGMGRSPGADRWKRVVAGQRRSG